MNQSPFNQSLIVQKYGGTSVADIERIQNVAQHIAKSQKEYPHIVVIVSAMGKTTDTLLHMARAITALPHHRETDALLATGEQVTMSLLCMALQSIGVQAISLTGQQSGILTDAVHTHAKIKNVAPTRILDALKTNHVVIIAGFQGVDDFGDITTLGRGGSDTTAVAIAAALGAKQCDIYTDVLGIYTSDPRLVEKAKLIDSMSYDEMLEMSKLGAQVMHPRSIELAKKFKVPLTVRSSFHLNHEGSNIMEKSAMEGAIVRGVAIDERIARITIPNVPDKPGIAYKLFSLLAEKNITIDMIIQNLNHDGLNDISFTAPDEELMHIRPILDTYIAAVNASPPRIKTSVAKLSIIGTGVTSDVNVASGLFKTIYELGINVEMISTSETRLSCIIDEDRAKDALNAIHGYFFNGQ